MDVDLFNNPLPGAEPPKPVTLYRRIRWQTIVELTKPHCGHCQMAAARKTPTRTLPRATTRRVGVEGSVLDLCEPHAAAQKIRDQRVEPFDREAGIERLAGQLARSGGRLTGLRCDFAREVAAALWSIIGPDLVDAHCFRELREAVIATMADPEPWDSDESDLSALIRYVRHLAGRAREVRAKAEQLRQDYGGEGDYGIEYVNGFEDAARLAERGPYDD